MVTIAICTYRRPSGVRQCLASLASMERPAGLDVEVVVVDNDAAGSARDSVHAVASDYPLPLRYFCEPLSGVSHARNRCLREAHGEWVAFVDDDEYVETAWLVELWNAARAGDADGIFGPVVPEFEGEPPLWLLTSGAHQRPRLTTGTPMRWGNCRSGNVIFRRSLFVENGSFDPRFAASGGEDSDFFWRCMATGAKLSWCDEAVVRERVPTSRMTRAWVLRRAFNGGRTFARLRATRGGLPSYLFDALCGFGNVLVYALPALAARYSRHHRALAYERKVIGGLGRLTASLGRVRGEYGHASSRLQAP